jgi:hypothetical protein
MKSPGAPPELDDDRPYHAGAFRLPAACFALVMINGHFLRIRAFCSGNLANALI